VEAMRTRALFVAAVSCGIAAVDAFTAGLVTNKGLRPGNTPPKLARSSSSLLRVNMGRKPIIGGNWKCNPANPAELPALIGNLKPCAETLDKCDVYVCPSNLHVGMVYDKFPKGIMVAPQNCNFKGCGAYTGEMAVDQMVGMGIKCCLIGHSERRGEFGLPTPKESNELMATKLAYILEKGLTAIFCIGEPLPVRQRGIAAVLAECVNQLKDIVPILKSLKDKSRVVIAYEPVWAIGTGVTASPEQAQETHKAIRDWIAKNVDQKTADEIRIQYGGSANAANAPELSAMPDIDGFLVGGASLKPEFADIIKAMVVARGGKNAVSDTSSTSSSTSKVKNASPDDFATYMAKRQTAAEGRAWSPNGSTNGKICQMPLVALYSKYNGALTSSKSHPFPASTLKAYNPSSTPKPAQSGPRSSDGKWVAPDRYARIVFFF